MAKKATCEYNFECWHDRVTPGDAYWLNWGFVKKSIHEHPLKTVACVGFLVLVRTLKMAAYWLTLPTAFLNEMARKDD